MSRFARFFELLEVLCVALCLMPHSRLYSHIALGGDSLPLIFDAVPKFAKDRGEKKKMVLRPVAGVDLNLWAQHIPPRENWLVGAAAAIHARLVSPPGPRDDWFERARAIVHSRPVDPSAVPPFVHSKLVVDQHTRKGSSSGGSERFALGGCLVKNEVLRVSPVFQRGYMVAKLGLPKEWTLHNLMEKEAFAREVAQMGLRETVLFSYETRAQLTCSMARPDTYFARLWGTPVFVKGPFPPSQLSALPLQQWAHGLKGELRGLSPLFPHIFQALPDRWMEGVGVGCRNKVARDTPQTFLVWDSLVPVDLWPLPQHNRSSKLWPDTPVVDWKALGDVVGTPDPSVMDGASLDAFILACVWRYAAAVPDNALRNFVWVRATGLVYSIDEDNMLTKDAPSAFRFGADVRGPVQARIRDNFKELRVILQEWIPVMQRHSGGTCDLRGAMSRVEKVSSSSAALAGMFDYPGGSSSSSSGKRKKREVEDEDDGEGLSD
eukprot:TRINITY_DN7099_c0_g1_i4.p1 TRINITY_DN7099_c0_g1~~TRINITY_DN7099_c0_g1_i4.p1  ORF type:complete len:492 (-),score=67.50 TRINITY_DN7099_c0_g1_i4:103-1578(-)